MPSAAASKIGSERKQGTWHSLRGVLIHNLSEVIADTFLNNHSLMLDILSCLR